ncbi:MAG: hypothetical protein RLZZ241_2240 [Bacteroidota bacterium]|jgi:cysteine synthase A
MDSILKAIGNTPIVKLNKLVPDNAAEVWVKMEGLNPTGSYKDRMALSVIANGLASGSIKSTDTLVEYTGGSTGSSLAFVAAVFGLKFIAVSSDAFSQGKLNAMKKFGAEVLIIPSHGKGITPELIQEMKRTALQIAEKEGYFYTDQFGSLNVVRGYEPMGREICNQIGNSIDYFCAAVGTAGAFMGALAGMKSGGANPKAIALETLQSPLLTEGKGGSHRVEGIGVGFAPPFLNTSKLAEIRAIDQERAFEMRELLAQKEGLYCGTSSGLNVFAAIELAKTLTANQKVVTLACDSGLKYT